MTNSSRDLYADVTRQIIAALDAGTPPWNCPWQGQGLDARPANATTGRRYRGINTLLLNFQARAQGYAHSRWLTFQQAQRVGGQVRRGERGTPIVFFKLHEVDGAERSCSTPSTMRVVPLLRGFTVFNVEQVDGLPESLRAPSARPCDWEPIAMAEALLLQSGAQIAHGGAEAFYVPSHDAIRLPERHAFVTAADYYATALHELTHWTGHPTRCDRPLGRRHGLEAYAFEELVAEIGSAFLCNHCGLVGEVQHASYVAAWLQALRQDKRLIFTAAAQAQRAADFLLGPEDRDASITEPLESAAA